MGFFVLFTMQFVAVVFAWMNQRRNAMMLFGLNLLFAIVYFIHHMTDAVGLSL